MHLRHRSSWLILQFQRLMPSNKCGVLFHLTKFSINLYIFFIELLIIMDFVCFRFVDEDKPLALWESNDDKLELDDMKSIQDKRDKWLLFPKRTIRELLESTQVRDFVLYNLSRLIIIHTDKWSCYQVEKCLVVCTVYAIDSDWGWYYFGCCICNKKVVKVGTVVKTIRGKETTTHLWWCELCKENVSNVSPRLVFF